MSFDVIFQFGECGFNALDEIEAARSQSAHGHHRVALRKVIRHREHFSIRAETMRDAFDDLVRSLVGPRVKDLDFRRGFNSGQTDVIICAVEDDCDRRAHSIAIKRELANEFVAGSGGMARLAGSDFRPAMQQAVAINQNAHQSHDSRLIKKAKCKIKNALWVAWSSTKIFAKFHENQRTDSRDRADRLFGRGQDDAAQSSARPKSRLRSE